MWPGLRARFSQSIARNIAQKQSLCAAIPAAIGVASCFVQYRSHLSVWASKEGSEASKKDGSRLFFTASSPKAGICKQQSDDVHCIPWWRLSVAQPKTKAGPASCLQPCSFRAMDAGTAVD